MSSRIRHKEGRFLINIGGNVFFQGLYMALAFWYSPYLLRNLGPALFGLVPLITSLTAYLAIISTAIDSSVGRNLSMAVKLDDHQQAAKIVNTAFKVYIAVVLVFLIIGGFGWNYLDVILRLPESAGADARWLFLAVFGAFCLTTLSAPFKCSLFSHNLVYVNKIIQVLAYSLSIAIVVSWFTAFSPNLRGVAVGNISGGLLTAFCSIMVAFFLMPYFRLSVRQFDPHIAREIISVGGWLIVNLIGALLYLKIDLLVVNRLFGPVMTGFYAIVLQLSHLLRVFSSQIVSAFTPSFMYRMAENDKQGLFDYSRYCIRFLSVVLALLIGGLCGFGDVFLTLWVGNQYAFLHGVLCVALFHLCVNISVSPLFSVQIATGHVKTPGIVTFLLGFVNLGLALFLAGPAGWGLYGVAAAGAIALTGKNALFTPLYGAKILGLRRYVYLPDIFMVVIATAAVSGISFSVNRLLVIDSWTRLIAVGGLIGLVYIPFAWFLMMRKTDRQRLLGERYKNSWVCLGLAEARKNR